MKTLRRLAYVALGIAFAHIVFGAIVRITGSGLGCGDHWPKCHGYWVPPFTRLDLVIEVSHRYLALTLSLAVLALAVTALRRRREPGVGGPGGVLRPAALAGVFVVAAALFGALTVRYELTNKYVIVVHLALAIATLASIALAAMRAGGLGASLATPASGSRSTYRGAVIAAALAFLAVVLGGLTAHVLGANTSCLGFPHCSRAASPGAPLHIHLTHRVIAFLLLGHLVALTVGVSRRRESALLVWAARVALGTVVLQIVVAAALVELHLPPVLRSLHQAIGTLVWLTLFVFAALARRASSGGALGAVLPPAAPLVAPGDVHGRGVVATGTTAPGTVAQAGALPGGATTSLAAAPFAAAPATPTVDEVTDDHADEAAEEARSSDDPIVVAIEPEVWAAMSGASAAAFGVEEEAISDAQPQSDTAPLDAADATPDAEAPHVEPVEGVPDDEPRDAATTTPFAAREVAVEDADAPPARAVAAVAAAEHADVEEVAGKEVAGEEVAVAEQPSALSLDDEVAMALEALMATSAVVDLNEDDEETDDADEEPDRDDKLAALQAELAERARIEAMLLEAELAEREAFEGRAVDAPVAEVIVVEAAAVVAEAEAGVAEAAVVEEVVAAGTPDDVSPIPAEVAQLPPRRPPTLAVLIARGADF